MTQYIQSFAHDLLILLTSNEETFLHYFFSHSEANSSELPNLIEEILTPYYMNLSEDLNIVTYCKRVKRVPQLYVDHNK